MTTTKDKESASGPGKRKRAEVNSVDEEVAVKQKKTHVDHDQSPGDIVTAALEKLAELERYINEEEEEDEDDDDHSDYNSDNSGGSEEEEVMVGGNEIMGTSSFNPEVVGFAICAQEAIDFLKVEGFGDQNPLIVNMKNRLLNQLNDYQSALQGERNKTHK